MMPSGRAAIVTASLGSVLAAAVLMWSGLPRHAAATATAPVWTETPWPFPNDPWGKGKAFRCKATDCGTEVNVYLRDIAEVRDATEDLRSFTRINGRPGIRMQVQKQSGQNTVAVADGIRVEAAKINNEVPGVRLTVLNDSSVFISRSIASVKECSLP